MFNILNFRIKYSISFTEELLEKYLTRKYCGKIMLTGSYILIGKFRYVLK